MSAPKSAWMLDFLIAGVSAAPPGAHVDGSCAPPVESPSQPGIADSNFEHHARRVLMRVLSAWRRSRGLGVSGVANRAGVAVHDRERRRSGDCDCAVSIDGDALGEGFGAQLGRAGDRAAARGPDWRGAAGVVAAGRGHGRRGAVGHSSGGGGPRGARGLPRAPSRSIRGSCRRSTRRSPSCPRPRPQNHVAHALVWRASSKLLRRATHSRGCQRSNARHSVNTAA